MEDFDIRKIEFELIWKRQNPNLSEELTDFWNRSAPQMEQKTIQERLHQCVFAVRSAGKKLIGVSTAIDVHVERLHHRFYATRLLLDTQFRIPGLMSALMVKTRDHLEAIHKIDVPPEGECVGLITIVENERLQKYRNEAVWPASGLVYIGDTPKGFPIRIYYFKGAKIQH